MPLHVHVHACLRACIHARLNTVVWVRISRMCEFCHSEIVYPLYVYMYHIREDNNVCYNPDIIMGIPIVIYSSSFR